VRVGIVMLRRRSFSSNSSDDRYSDDSDSERYPFFGSISAVPTLRQQSGFRQPKHGICAPFCFLFSLVAIIFLLTISHTIANNSLYFKYDYAHSVDEKAMVTGLNEAVIIYTIFAIMSGLVIFARKPLHTIHHTLVSSSSSLNSLTSLATNGTLPTNKTNSE
jgi:hypothetical protein